jgi:hypothetical protein
MKQFLIIFVMILCHVGYAQVDDVYTGEQKPGDKKKKGKESSSGNWQNIKEKLVYGGFIMPGYGVSSFGSTFYVSANPTLGYRLTEKLMAGVGFNYNYISFRPRSGGSITQSIYGPNAFARYMVFDNVFAQVQYDKLNQPDYFSAFARDRIWVDYVLAGGGYYQRLGERSALVLSIMYNLTPNRNSVYRNPVIQMGFIGGF